jgi:hypothetical protein
MRVMRKRHRPPIGKVVMTGAERVRRYRLKHQPKTKPVTKPAAADLAPYKAEIAKLKAEVGT